MEKEYRICSHCIMDNRSDDTIVFDSNGQCNYCKRAYYWKDKLYFPNQEGELKLQQMLAIIKKEGKGKKFDCIMGISGGLDSSYLAYLASNWNLRVLAVHIDDGYDESVTVENIRKLCEAGNIELHTIKPDDEQFNALTRAYIVAGVPNLAIPQDSVLFAYLYKMAFKYRIKYFLSGSNFALENTIQKGNTWSAFDCVNIRDINKRFGTMSIDKLPLLSTWKMLFYKYVYGMKTVQLLNYIDYNRERAIRELNSYCGYEYYGNKHLENTLTKFIQLYYFPNKFQVDKRRSHFSSMIVSGQMSREEALKEIEKPLYDPVEIERDIDLILRKLKMSRKEFEYYMSLPPVQHTAYKVSLLYKAIRKISAYRVKQRNKK